MKRNLIFSALATLFVATGCSESSFQGSTPVKQEAEDTTPANRTLQLSCDEATGLSSLSTQFSSEKPVQVQIEGEICGIKGEEIEQELNVMFVIDFSGSMGANDGLENDSCGRLVAAQAIVDKMQETADKGVSVSMGAIQFSSFSETHVPMVDLEEFKASVTADNFCGSVGGTNYQAALQETQDQLANVSGRKLVYFVTDGAPTEPLTTEGAAAAGLTAAESLRTSIDELTLNAIFLEGGIGGIGGLDDTFNPQQYLEELVGAPDRVKLVANAADIASEITEFDTPDPIVVDTNSASTTHVAASFGEKPVQLEDFSQDSAREGVWTFITEPVLLFAEKGESVVNEIILNVATSDGETHEARIKIEFEQTKKLSK